jgi:hypothetical protein
MSKLGKWQVCAGLALALAASLAVAEPPRHEVPRMVRPAVPRPGFRHDFRYGHNQFYPTRGFTVRTLPPGAFAVTHPGGRYFFAGGVWYAARGPAFVVVAPPIGVFVPVLPVAYTTVWVGGLPYYYANDTFYEWVDAQHGYQVVDPPPGAEVPAEEGAPPPDDAGAPPPDGQDAPGSGYAPPPSAAPPAAGGAIGAGLFVYPTNGQGEQQQSQDKWECHQWASGQTGFDPTAAGGGPGGPAKRLDYQRAMTACLTGRGYTVK